MIKQIKIKCPSCDCELVIDVKVDISAKMLYATIKRHIETKNTHEEDFSISYGNITDIDKGID